MSSIKDNPDFPTINSIMAVSHPKAKPIAERYLRLIDAAFESDRIARLVKEGR